MSNFGNAAATLLRKTTQEIQNNKKPDSREDILAKLDAAGFGTQEVFQDLKDLYDNTEDDSLKRMIAVDILKVRGLMQSENQKAAPPTIVIQVQGDGTRLNTMLCPQYD